jgi:tRNA(Ile)-lysidine synthase
VKTLNFPLTVRNWNEGDYFYPIGMKGKKKLSKFFKDNKLSIVDKENTLILCSNDQVVWVLGMRADNRFMSTEKTINFLNISIKNNASN